MPESTDHPTVTSTPAPAIAAEVDVVLLTRRGCHLCEQAQPVVHQAARAHAATVRVVDVDSEPALRERYTAHVPVVFVRGRLLAYWAVDLAQVEHALAGGHFDEPVMV